MAKLGKGRIPKLRKYCFHIISCNLRPSFLMKTSSKKFAQEESKDELLVKVAFAFGNFILPK